MQTPSKVTAEEFNSAVTHFLEENCIRVPQGDKGNTWKCKKCNSDILGLSVCLSIHWSLFNPDCAGHGDVQTIKVPYCPMCEKRPEEYGCIHD